MVRMDFPGDAVAKNLPAVHETHETWVRSLCQKGPLEDEMAAHSCILCLENGQRTRPAVVPGVTHSGTRFSA